MPTRKTGIAAELTLDRTQFSKAIQQSRQDAAAMAAGMEAIRQKQVISERQFTEQMTAQRKKAMGAADYAKLFRKETEVIKRDSVERVVAEETAAAARKRSNEVLERRIRLEQKLAENRARLAAQARAGVSDGLDYGPHLRTGPGIDRRMLSGATGTFSTGGGVSAGGSTMTTNIAAMGSRGATNAGMGMLMLSQTIDDLQYGIKGVVNNVAPLVMSLGGGTGLAGVLTIAAVGVNQFAKVLERFSGTARLEAQNAENAEARRRQIERAREEAAARGEAAGAALLRGDASAQGSRDFAALQEQRARDLGALRGQLAGNGPTTVEERKAAVERLESGYAAVELRAREAAMAKKQAEEEMAALKARKRAREEDIDARIAAEETFIRKVETIGEGSMVAAAYLDARATVGDDPTKAARARLAELKAAKAGAASEDVRMAELGAMMPALEESYAKKRAQQNQEMADMQEARHALEVAKLQEQIDNAEKGRELAKEAGRVMLQFFEQAGESFRKAAQAEREAEAKRKERERKAQEEAAKQERRERAGGDLEIARLRSRGKFKHAEKLAGDRAEGDKVRELMDAGIPEADAKRMAKEDRQYREDEQYLSRTGRVKMRGATNAGSYQGLDAAPKGSLKDEWSFDKLDAMKADRAARPLKSEMGGGAKGTGKAADAGISASQGEEMLGLLRGIKVATERNAPTVAEQLKPKTAA